jgi:hypothetical protein
MRKVLVVVASTLLLAGCSSTATPAPSPANGDVVEGMTIAVGGLTVGQCLSQDAATGDVGIAQAVDCAKPHYGEVMSSGKIRTIGDTFDEAKIAELANNFCITSFETFDGLRYDKSSLQMFPLVPTSKSWKGGDRVATCVVYDPAGSITGTLKGSNR